MNSDYIEIAAKRLAQVVLERLILRLQKKGPKTVIELLGIEDYH